MRKLWLHLHWLDHFVSENCVLQFVPKGNWTRRWFERTISFPTGQHCFWHSKSRDFWVPLHWYHWHNSWRHEQRWRHEQGVASVSANQTRLRCHVRLGEHRPVWPWTSGHCKFESSWWAHIANVQVSWLYLRCKCWFESFSYHFWTANFCTNHIPEYLENSSLNWLVGNVSSRPADRMAQDIDGGSRFLYWSGVVYGILKTTLLLRVREIDSSFSSNARW